MLNQKLLLVAAFAGLFSAHSRAQGGTPSSVGTNRTKPVLTNDFRIPLHRHGITISAFNAASNLIDPVKGTETVEAAARRYLYMPAFLFVRNGEGKIAVDVKDDGRVRVPMVFDATGQREEVFAYLKNGNFIDDSSRVEQVVPMSAKQVCIETTPTYQPYVRLLEASNYDFEAFTTVEARLNPELAKKFAEDLKAGDVSFRVTFLFNGYEVDRNQNIAIVSFENLAKTEAVKNVAGRGGRGLLNRHMSRMVIEKALVQANIFVIKGSKDPLFDQLCERAIEQFTTERIALTKNWHDELTKAMTDMGYTKADIAPDIVTKLATKEQSKNKEFARLHFENWSKSKGGGGASVNIIEALDVSGGGGGEDERKYVESILIETLREHGVESEFNGIQYTPKSVNVYAFNAGQMSKAGRFTIVTGERIDGEGVRTFDLTPNQRLVDVGAIGTVQDRLVPVGTIVAYAGAIAPPGWLMCDGNGGKPLDAVKYPALAGVLSTTFDPRGKTVFIPDLRGRTVICGGQGIGLTNRVPGHRGGMETVTLTEAHLPSHTHEVSDPGHTHTNTDGGDHPTAFYVPSGHGRKGNVGHGHSGVSSATLAESRTGISVNATGGGQAHDNMPPFIVTNYIIKY